MDLILQVPDGCSSLLCKKGQQTLSGARLLHAELHDHEEQVLTPLNSGADCEALWSQVLHEIGHPVGLQQCLDKGRRQVKGCLLDQLQLV